MHAFNLYIKSAALQIKSSRTYSANFWFGLIGITFLYGSQFLILLTTLSYFKTIKGWGVHEVLFLYSLFLFTYGLMISVFAGIRDFNGFVHNGYFDIFLVRPHSIMLQIMSGRLELNSWAHISYGGCILAWSLSHLSIEWTLVKSFQLMQIIIGGMLIQGGVLLLWAAVSYWLLQTGSLVALTFSINNNYLTYPLTAYDSTVSKLVTIFPLAFISYYPAQWFLEKDKHYFSFYIGQYTIFVGTAFFIIMLSFWKYARKYYQSTGN